jgi:butyrate kinase
MELPPAGGLLHPVASGVYEVNDAMLADLRAARYGEHASNLGALLAAHLAAEFSCPAFIADPVVVDEMEPLARLSGIPEIERRSTFHALNQKYTARLAAAQLGKNIRGVQLDCSAPWRRD